MKRALVRTVACAALLGALVPARPVHATVVERVVAVVGERAILLSDLRGRAQPFLVQIMTQVPSGAQRNAAISQLYKGLIEKLVDEELEQRAAVQAKVAVTPHEIDEALARVAAQNGVTLDRLFVEAKRTGMDEVSYREELRRQLLQTKLINVRLQGRIRVSDDDLRAAYQKLVMDEREKLSFKVGWVLVAVRQGASPRDVADKRKLAEEVARAATTGDFAAVAARYSDDASSRGSGGVLPAAHMNELSPPLRRIVASLEPGQVSAVLGVPTGFAVLKLIEREESSLPSFDEARNELAQRVYLEKMTQARRSWLDNLRRQQHVEVRL
ncbi:MAG TPA: peptidylprolyl isomerase [Polyangiaceae bacterium]|jgi:peptidyl-prolyl cis-trans isomerase SurA|nr:peptidylprolyl isomerase [Polyangiaceae bacterium]